MVLRVDGMRRVCYPGGMPKPNRKEQILNAKCIRNCDAEDHRETGIRLCPMAETVANRAPVQPNVSAGVQRIKSHLACIRRLQFEVLVDVESGKQAWRENPQRRALLNRDFLEAKYLHQKESGDGRR